MHTTVIIPFRPRGEAGLLAWTLAAFASQELQANQTFNVLVGIDGGQASDIPQTEDDRIKFHLFPHIGAAATRNALVKMTTSQTDLLLFINSDSRPFPDLIRHHDDALARLPERSMVLGAAPWERQVEPSVFDAFIAETAAIFTLHYMKAEAWYDYRSAYTLNLSMWRKDFLSSGGFQEKLRPVYFEDLEFAYRVLGTRSGIFHQPQARVLHRHRMSLDQYLDREELLGLMAPVFLSSNPEAFAHFMGRRASAPVLAERYRLWVLMDRPTHSSVYQRLGHWATLPESRLGEGEARSLQLATLYDLHLPLKRLAYRLGFLRGVQLANDAFWQMRRPAGLWRHALNSVPT